MNMKLTSRTKEKFVAAVVAGMPSPEKQIEELRKVLTAHVQRQMPLALRRAIKIDVGVNGWVNTARWYLRTNDRDFYFTAPASVNRRTLLNVKDLPESLAKRVEFLLSVIAEKQKAISDLKGKLVNVLASCGTDAALRKRLPDLAHLIPSASAPAKDQAEPQTIDVKKLGWKDPSKVKKAA
jgi:hypothetical protein